MAAPVKSREEKKIWQNWQYPLVQCNVVVKGCKQVWSLLVASCGYGTTQVCGLITHFSFTWISDLMLYLGFYGHYRHSEERQ